MGQGMLKGQLLVENTYLEWHQPGVRGRYEPAGNLEGQWQIRQVRMVVREERVT